MKSEILENRYFIECACAFPDHLLIFDYIEEDDMISIYIINDYKLGFIKRLWAGIKYIFGRSEIMTDGITITEQNIKQLEEVIKKIKEIK